MKVTTLAMNEIMNFLTKIKRENMREKKSIKALASSLAVYKIPYGISLLNPSRKLKD